MVNNNKDNPRPALSKPHELSEFPATAICGNDITSSCLYVSALTIAYAGVYACITLLAVSLVHYLFRKIYGEVVGALPLNGGAYNVLLNTTSKSNASVAACLTILSYMATAVISATEAMHYLHSMLHNFPVLWATAGLLFVFMALTISGISESSKVAVFIFTLHLTSLLFLVIIAVWVITNNGLEIFKSNLQIKPAGGFWKAIFLGFSVAMLGISGFESSANFVEEQKKGVFPKTLRNMWLAVTVINPLIALLAVSVLPIGIINEHKESLLSFMGKTTGGEWLAYLISIDAVLVLSGAVLTSYIGVSGLVKRMTLDRIFPQFLLKENQRGSTYRIFIGFFLLCISILLITEGSLGPLAGVYTISFLIVMLYFAYGNLLLKLKRSRLPRPETATPFAVSMALLLVFVALYGNIELHPDYLLIFLQYFIPSIIVVYILLNRTEVAEIILNILRSFIDNFRRVSIKWERKLYASIRKLNEQHFVFFSKGDDISILNKVMIYVQENEITKHLIIVTVIKEGQSVSDSFMTDLEVLDRAYPEIDIDYRVINGVFGPELVDKLCTEWNIPKNFMFISSPSDRFSYRVSELGGVRLIL